MSAFNIVFASKNTKIIMSCYFCFKNYHIWPLNNKKHQKLLHPASWAFKFILNDRILTYNLQNSSKITIVNLLLTKNYHIQSFNHQKLLNPSRDQNSIFWVFRSNSSKHGPSVLNGPNHKKKNNPATQTRSC